MDMREAFEAWYQSNYPTATRSSYSKLNGRYVDVEVSVAWQAWQAALQSQPAMSSGAEPVKWSDAQVSAVVRAFWRRIHPYIYEPNEPPYPKEFGKQVPVEFQANMATALCALPDTYTHPAPTAQDDEAHELAEGVISRIIAFMGVRDDYFEGYDVPPVPMALEALDHLIRGVKDSGLKFDAEENDFVVAQDSKVPEGAIHNGLECLRRLRDHYNFTDEQGHELGLCYEYSEVERAFHAIAAPSLAEKPDHPEQPLAMVADKPQWVRCEERMPTEKDSDFEGCIWVSNDGGETFTRWFLQALLDYADEFVADGSMWMPTGLQRPQPPGGE